MFKKITLIFILAIALAAFLVLRPYIFKKTEAPLIVDRLPDADFLGRAYILDVARETSGMLFYHKVPFRDLFSYEFLLSQGKMYGLNLQNPAYLFANETGNWGAIIEVSDSSKILEGIERLRKFVDIKDTMMNNQNVFQIKKENGYLTYSNNYLFIYKGANFNAAFKRVTQAKYGDYSPAWKKFLKEKQFKDEKLVLYSNWRKLKENGVKTAIFAHDSDSVSFSLLAYVRNKNPLNVSMKKEGLNFKSGEFTNKMLNVHLNISKLRNAPEDPLYKWLVKTGKKVSFPTVEFIEAWEGDLSMRLGGYQLVKETYIESVLDEDFNVSEVVKEKEVKIPGFSVLFSVNKNGRKLINQLLSKGILTKEDGLYRFLYSPQLKMRNTNDYFIFHSGQFTPKMESHARNSGIWTQKGTKVEFTIDSLSRHEIFGNIYIPIDRILKRNRFF